MTSATFDVEIDSELETVLAASYKALEGLAKANKELHKLLSSERNEPCKCGSNKKSKKCCNTEQNKKIFSSNNGKIYSILKIFKNPLIS